MGGASSSGTGQSELKNRTGPSAERTRMGGTGAAAMTAAGRYERLLEGLPAASASRFSRRREARLKEALPFLSSPNKGNPQTMTRHREAIETSLLKRTGVMLSLGTCSEGAVVSCPWWLGPQVCPGLPGPSGSPSGCWSGPGAVGSFEASD